MSAGYDATIAGDKLLGDALDRALQLPAGWEQMAENAIKAVAMRVAGEKGETVALEMLRRVTREIEDSLWSGAGSR